MKSMIDREENIAKLLNGRKHYPAAARWNNGDCETIVPYEVILFNNGIICKKSPHPVAASHMLMCEKMITQLTHDSWPIGFNFTTFHYIDADHERRVDFVETINLFFEMKESSQRWLYETCSDLKIGDGECPRFENKDDAFSHCMNLIRNEFDVKPVENASRCIKKLYKNGDAGQ